MTEADKKRLIQNGFDAYQWGRPFDLEFRRGRYTDVERALCRVGWDKAERRYVRLEQERINEAEASRRAWREADRISDTLDEAKKELFNLFGDKYAKAIETYLDALLEKRDHDRQQ